MRKNFAILRYALRQWPRLLIIVGLNAVMAGIAALQPWPMKLLVDYALRPNPRMRIDPIVELLVSATSRPGSSSPPPLPHSLCSSSTLCSPQGWPGLGPNAGRRMVYDVAADLFRRLQRVSLLVHSRRSVGDSLSRLTGDTWGVYTVTDALLIGPVRNVLAIATVIAVAWRLDPGLTLLSLSIVPPLAASATFFGRRLLRRARRARQAPRPLFSFLQQTVSALPIVQAFGTEDRNLQHFDRISEVEIARIRRGSLLQNAFTTTKGLITTVGTAAILVAGGRRVIAGTMSIGTLLVFLAYMRTVQNALRALLDNYGALKAVEANVERVLEILDSKDTVSDEPGAQPLAARADGEGRFVRLEGVVFGYDPGRPVLHGINLEARPGEIVALVGATGAGKSTLVGMLPRFFDPWEGRVTVDGIDVRHLQLKSLRSEISLVLQEAFILPLSIADNISYGRPDAARSEIEAVARAANAHEFIERLPQGYDTVVGERGATLSGGERQRLAIARAFLRDAPILILDEPTSALDAGTESLILAALERLMRGRTVFVIAHRLSTVRRADRIIVLDHGRIAEQGTHDELLATGGLYYKLHNSQFAIRSPGAAA